MNDRISMERWIDESIFHIRNGALFEKDAFITTEDVISLFHKKKYDENKIYVPFICDTSINMKNIRYLMKQNENSMKCKSFQHKCCHLSANVSWNVVQSNPDIPWNYLMMAIFNPNINGKIIVNNIHLFVDKHNKLELMNLLHISCNAKVLSENLFDFCVYMELRFAYGNIQIESFPYSELKKELLEISSYYNENK